MRWLANILASLWLAVCAALPVLAQEEEAPIMSFPSPETTRGGEPAPPPEAREQVVAGISSDAVSITTSFDGSEIIIYGAVRRETPIPGSSLLMSL